MMVTRRSAGGDDATVVPAPAGPAARARRLPSLGTLWCLLLCILATAYSAAPAGAAPRAKKTSGSGWTSYLTGPSTNVTRATTGGVVLMGGGPDVDAAILWMIQKSGGGNFVVLRASGTDGYNPYIYDLAPVASVETLVVTSRTGANSSYVADRVRNAEAVFIAGGDQASYWNLWRGTALSSALQYLADRGTPLGGTSAGMAVLGEYVYTAVNNTVYPEEALANPYDFRVTLGTGFLSVPNMQKIVTETHFYQRDRMGRVVAFLARLLKDGYTTTAYGVSADEGTAVLVEANGSASVVGSDYAYFYRTPGPPETCVSGAPLTFRNVEVYRIAGGSSATFSFNTWSGSGGLFYTVSANNGLLTSSRGSIY